LSSLLQLFAVASVGEAEALRLLWRFVVSRGPNATTQKILALANVHEGIMIVHHDGTETPVSEFALGGCPEEVARPTVPPAQDQPTAKPHVRDRCKPQK
jgi:hypothetical protein